MSTLKNKHDIEIALTPVKRNVYLYTLEYDAPQGEEDIHELTDFIIDREVFEKRRPSRKEGLWRLSTGDWARRDGARFIKIDGEWQEVTLTSLQHGMDNKEKSKPSQPRKKKTKKVEEESVESSAMAL